MSELLGGEHELVSQMPRETSWIMYLISSLMVVIECPLWPVEFTEIGDNLTVGLYLLREAQGPGLQIFLIRIARQNVNMYSCGEM